MDELWRGVQLLEQALLMLPSTFRGILRLIRGLSGMQHVEQRHGGVSNPLALGCGRQKWLKSDYDLYCE